MIQLIYAFCQTLSVENKVEYAFGLNNGLPWKRINKDLENFKNRTQDTILIMGAKTFMGFKSPLPGRISIVVQDLNRPQVQTQDGSFANGYITENEFLSFLKGKTIKLINPYRQPIDLNHEFNYSIIGGVNLLEKSLPYADKIIRTSIKKYHRINSDVKLPEKLVNLPGFNIIETHWYQIDDLTNISETILVKE